MKIIFAIFVVFGLIALSESVQTEYGNLCFLPPAVGDPGRICLAAFHNWYYNPGKNKCEQFLYGGCGGNANNFPTEAMCWERCKDEGLFLTTTEFHLITE